MSYDPHERFDPDAPKLVLEGLNVLHVEDDPHIADVVHFVLNEQQQLPVRRVVQASTRRAAMFAILDHGPHDIALIDYELPDATGLELLHDISLHSPDLTTIMVTAHQDVMVGIEALEAGATSFLRKDELTPMVLMEKIRLALARKRYETGLWSMAHADPVTGLANRRALELSYQITSAHAGPGEDAVMVAVFDLNDFKRVNDLLGHATGDSVLRQFADHLRALFRNGDTVARTGGDEFVVVGVHDGSGETAASVQDRARSIRIAVPSDRGDLVVTCAVGVALGPAGAPLARMLDVADKDMYRDKAWVKSGA